MNKIINSQEKMIKEMIDGYIVTCPDLLEALPEYNGVVLKNKKDKVSIVVGGGSGNEPWVIGYVGKGLADGAALGNVYSAPPPKAILGVTRALNYEKGVIYLCTNHSGDVLNFELASELAGLEGIKAKCIFVTDDIASAPRELRNERRGVAGIAIVAKIAGAVCDSGLNLDESVRIIEKANQNTFTFSVTTSPGYLPNGKAMCDLPEGFIEYGMGFNGEPGILRTELVPADEIADTMLKFLLDDSKITCDDEVSVMINGFGFTSLLELSIVNRRVCEKLSQEGIAIHDTSIDTLFCPQGTGGFSISMLKMDEELKKYYDGFAYSPFFKKCRYDRIYSHK